MSHRSTSAATVPTEGSATVVGILCTVIASRASSIRTRSVCVPPISTPTLSIAHRVSCSKQPAARSDAAINSEDCAGHEARPIGSGEHDHVGDFSWLGGAAERQRLDEVAPVLGIARAILSLALHQMNQPLGRSGSGIDTQDAHAVIRAYGAECAREA